MRSGVRSTQMRYFCWNLVSTPGPYSSGYPILKLVAGSNKVRGRKKRKKASNHAVKKAATDAHTRRRRARLISLSSGPMAAIPPADAALEVPTAGVPTYLVDSPPRATEAAAEAATTGAAARGTDEVAAATGAAAAGASAGSPSRAAISASFRGGRLLRPRRACSAAIVDLLHFFPCATHPATSALMAPPAVLTATAAGGAGTAATAGGAGDGVAGAAGAGAPSPDSHAIGWPAFNAAISASLNSGRPFRWR